MQAIQKNEGLKAETPQNTALIEQLEHLPNILTLPQQLIMRKLLRGGAATARQIYREIARLIIETELLKAGRVRLTSRAILDKLHGITTDEELEKFFSTVRGDVKFPAYNTIQKNLEYLVKESVVEVRQENGTKKYGVSKDFFVAWKNYREEALRKIRKLMKEHNTDKTNATVSLAGFRPIDVSFFDL